MATLIDLPDGRTLEAPDDVSDEEILRLVQQAMPELGADQINLQFDDAQQPDIAQQVVGPRKLGGGLGRGLSRIGLGAVDLLGDLVGSLPGVQAIGAAGGADVSGSSFRNALSSAFGFEDANRDFEQFAQNVNGLPTRDVVQRPLTSQGKAVGLGLSSGVAETAGLLADIPPFPFRAIDNALIKPFTGEPLSPLFESGAVLRRELSDRGLGFENLAELDPANRPSAAFGEVVGETVPIIPLVGPVQELRSGVKAAQQLRNLPIGSRLVQKGVAAPNLRVEAASAIGAGTGALAAEAIDPGDPATSAALQIAGALVSPAVVANRLFGSRPIPKGTFSKLSDQAKAVLTEEARLNRAAVEIRRALEEAGESPEEVLRSIQALDELPEATARAIKPFTADVKTGSRGLSGLRNLLSKKSTKAEQAFAEANAAGHDALVQVADRLATSNAPGSLNQAARLYRAAFEQTFAAHRDNAIKAAQEAAARLGNDPAAAQLAAGQALAKAIEDAERAARTFERQVWQSVPKQKIFPKASADAITEARAQILADDTLASGAVEATFNRIVPGPNRVRAMDSDQLIILRSELLTAARQAAAAGDPNRARLLNNVASGILDDLAQIPGTTAARAVSRELNDAFTRSFAGDILASSRTGAERIDPGIAGARALTGASGGTQRILNADEARAAAGFDPNQVNADLSGIPGLPDAAETAAQAQARAAQAQSALEAERTSQLARTVDPNTGRVSTTRLGNELRSSQSAGLPDSQAAGQTALQAEQAAQRVERRVTAAQRRLNTPGESVLALAANREGETASSIISGAIGPRVADPERRFAELARIAKNKRLTPGQRAAAVSDLKAGTLDFAIKSARNGEAIDFQRLRSTLLGSRTGRPSLVDLMQRNGVISADEANDLRTFVNIAAETAENAARAGSLTVDPSAITEASRFFRQFIGARLGKLTTRVAGDTGSLQLRSATTRILGRLLDKMPNLQTDDLLIRALNDPDFLKLLLQREVGSARLGLPQRVRFSKVTAGLVQAGLLPQDAFEELQLEADALMQEDSR